MLCCASVRAIAKRTFRCALFCFVCSAAKNRTLVEARPFQNPPRPLPRVDKPEALAWLEDWYKADTDSSKAYFSAAVEAMYPPTTDSDTEDSSSGADDSDDGEGRRMPRISMHPPKRARHAKDSQEQDRPTPVKKEKKDEQKEAADEEKTKIAIQMLKDIPLPKDEDLANMEKVQSNSNVIILSLSIFWCPTPLPRWL